MKPLVTGRIILGMDVKKKAPFEDLEKDLYLKVYSIGDIDKTIDISLHSLCLAKKYELYKIGDYGIVFVYRKDDGKTIGSDIVMYNDKIGNMFGVEYPKMKTLSIENSNPIKRNVNPDIDSLEIFVLSAEENHRKTCKDTISIMQFPDIGNLLAKE